MEACEECKNIEYHEIIDCIMSALDARDTYTAGHSQRVSDMAVELGLLLSGNRKKSRENVRPNIRKICFGQLGLYCKNRYGW